jgi:hypothetical protein
MKGGALIPLSDIAMWCPFTGFFLYFLLKRNNKIAKRMIRGSSASWVA